MKKIKLKDRRPLLDREIERLEKSLRDMSPYAKEYSLLSDKLAKLVEIKNNKKNEISKDVIAQILANFAVVLIVLNFERCATITSKALSLVWKWRV